MDTGTNWTPPTLKDWLNLGNESPLTEVNGRYLCECGLPANDFQIIDLRAWTVKPQDWACDGCHSKWKRELINVTGLREYDHDPVNRKIEEQKFKKDWLVAHGAPQVMIDETQAKIDSLLGL